MKFICEQYSLSSAINTVSKAINPRTTFPLLKGILLTVNEDGTLKLTSSNLDLSIEKIIDVQVIEPGSIVISAKLFMDIVRKLPKGEVKISLDEDKVTIESHSSTFTIIGQGSEDYPSIGELDQVSHQLTFDRELLSTMIGKTGFSASIDESKGIIVGILLELEDNSLNMIALDGFRMAIAREPMATEKEENIIISSKILNEINKILHDEKEEKVTLAISDKKAVMLMEKTKMTLRLMSGEFIKYKDILPKESNTKVKVNKNELLNSIERASLLAKEGKNNLIKCTVEGNVMLIESQSEEGEVKEDIIIEKEGNDICIGFNSKYVIDSLRVIEDEYIVLELNTSISPCLVKPVEGNEYEYLILPVRITNS